MAIALVGLLIVLFIFGCTQGKSDTNAGQTIVAPSNNTTGVSPPTMIYKTKANYDNLVPITLSIDKNEVIAYPDIRDVYYNGSLAYPTKLSQGYLLDNRGISATSVFLDINYEEYSKLSETPAPNELLNMAKEENPSLESPFLEIYDCGPRVFAGNSETEQQELNELIESGGISNCKVLLSNTS